MGKNSNISWTDHTFNIVWGCTEVSPACDLCYAREFAKRMGYGWGDAPRRVFGEKHWTQPYRWNDRADKEFGRPARVFCSSMADIFEVHPTVEFELQKLWPLIRQTPRLEWLLLTKRHAEIRRKLPLDMYPGPGTRPHVRMGVTVENQTYDFRVVDGVSWISAEPLFGYMNLRPFLKSGQITWVIIGGESKASPDREAREMPLEAAQDLIEQCQQYGVAVHFKQTGDVLARKLGLKDKSGKDPNEWPAELRIQEFPKTPQATHV